MNRLAMVRALGVAFSVALVGCGTAASVCGCAERQCERTLRCDDEPPPELNCEDPATGPAREECGIFVSSSLGDDASPGTRDEPVRTITRAVALAVEAPKHVYACAERFDEAVRLPSGVEIWGGLDCAHDWIWLGGHHRTVLAPEAGLVPLRIDTGAGRSTVADLRLEAADGVQPGASSVAMIIDTGAAAEVLRSELVAGDGASGAPGDAGDVQPATLGTPGNDGAPACSADSVAGAPATTAACDDGATSGGRGGDGNITLGGNGNNGQPEPIPNPQGLGLGGTGAGNGITCTAGAVGAPGADGAHGLGAHGPGIPTPGGWQGNPGKDGGRGLRGQGGAVAAAPAGAHSTAVSPEARPRAVRPAGRAAAVDAAARGARAAATAGAASG